MLPHDPENIHNTLISFIEDVGMILIITFRSQYIDALLMLRRFTSIAVH